MHVEVAAVAEKTFRIGGDQFFVDVWDHGDLVVAAECCKYRSDGRIGERCTKVRGVIPSLKHVHCQRPIDRQRCSPA